MVNTQRLAAARIGCFVLDSQCAQRYRNTDTAHIRCNRSRVVFRSSCVCVSSESARDRGIPVEVVKAIAGFQNVSNDFGVANKPTCFRLFLRQKSKLQVPTPNAPFCPKPSTMQGFGPRNPDFGPSRAVSGLSFLPPKTAVMRSSEMCVVQMMQVCGGRWGRFGHLWIRRAPTRLIRNRAPKVLVLSQNTCFIGWGCTCLIYTRGRK